MRIDGTPQMNDKGFMTPAEEIAQEIFRQFAQTMESEGVAAILLGEENRQIASGKALPPLLERVSEAFGNSVFWIGRGAIEGSELEAGTGVQIEQTIHQIKALKAAKDIQGMAQYLAFQYLS